MPMPRKVRALNGRQINVPRMDTIAAYIVAWPYDMPPHELAERAPSHGFERSSVASQVSTVRKKYLQLRWSTGDGPAVPIDVLLSDEHRPKPPPKPKSKPAAPEVTMSSSSEDDIDPAELPPPGRPPTHVVTSIRPVADLDNSVVRDPAPPSLRVVPPAFLKLAAPPAPTTPPTTPPAPPSTPPPAGSAEDEIRAWIAMGATLIDTMTAQETLLRARSNELGDELARVTAEYTEVTSRADALAAYIGVVRAGGGGV